MFVFGAFLLTSNRFRINTVTIVGDDTRAWAIRNVMENELAGVYFGLVPRDNLFVYPKGAIANSLRQIDPVIARVDLKRELGGELTVALALHTRDYVWCESASSTECRYVDEEGGAYATSTPAMGKFEIVSAEHLSKGVFSTIKDVLGGLATSNISARLINVSNEDIIYNIDEGWRLRTRLEDTSYDILRRMNSALSTNVLSDATARKNMDYLDVRLENKVFYKFK